MFGLLVLNINVNASERSDTEQPLPGDVDGDGAPLVQDIGDDASTDSQRTSSGNMATNSLIYPGKGYILVESRDEIRFVARFRSKTASRLQS